MAVLKLFIHLTIVIIKLVQALFFLVSLHNVAMQCSCAGMHT